MPEAKAKHRIGGASLACGVFLSVAVLFLVAPAVPTAAASAVAIGEDARAGNLDVADDAVTEALTPGSSRTLPDVDIDDDYANMAGNLLTIGVEPGDVATMIDVEFDEFTHWSETGDPGDVLCDDVTVNNIGNAEADDVHFVAGDLVGQSYGGIISSISFAPPVIVVGPGGSETFELCVAIPHDARADTYVGTIFLLADGDTQFDEMTVTVTVNCIPEMDVSATETPVVLVDGAGSKMFEVCNVGNCDLTGVGGAVTGLPIDIMTWVITVPPVIGWDECEIGSVDIAADDLLEAGTYYGTVTIAADGGATDSFPITVIVPEFPCAAFAEDVIEVTGTEGYVVPTTFIVENCGNVDLPPWSIEFAVEDLIGNDGDVIPADAVAIDSYVGIPYWGSSEFPLWVDLPDSMSDSLYTGTVLLLMDSVMYDDIELEVRRDTPVEGAFYAVLSDDGGVLLRWISGSLDSVEALSVFRATSPEGPYIKISDAPLPPTSPGQYEDNTVWPETTFWYELRAILLDGSEDVVGPTLASVTTGGRLAAELYPVCPNPSAGGVTMQFDVPSGGGPLTLEIHNSRGQLVKSLVEHHPGRGRHAVTWDGTDLRGRQVSSGAYFARLVTGQAISAQKLILIR